MFRRNVLAHFGPLRRLKHGTSACMLIACGFKLALNPSARSDTNSTEYFIDVTVTRAEQKNVNVVNET